MRVFAILGLALGVSACGSTAPSGGADHLTAENAGREVSIVGQARQDGDQAVLLTEGVTVDIDQLRWPADVVGTTIEVQGVLQRLRMPPAIGAAPPMLLPSGETTPTAQQSYEGLWRFRLSDAKWYPLQQETDAG